MATTNRSGFMDRLGLGGPDPAAILAQQQAQGGSSLGEISRRLGQNSAAGIGGLLGGAAGLATGVNDGRSVSGALGNIAQSAKGVRDMQQAQAAGISVKQLKDRKEIRRHLAELQSEDDGSLKSREDTLRSVAKKAQELGDLEVLGNTMAQLDEVKKQREEFGKLQDGRVRDQQDTSIKGVLTAYNEEGDPSSGVIGNEEGPVAKVGGVGTGLWVSDGKGGSRFEPFGDDFTTHEPTSGPQEETLDKRLRNIVTAPERREIRGQLKSNEATIRRSTKVIEDLIELSEKGLAEFSLGFTGKSVAGLDTVARNIRGVVDFIGSAGRSENNTELRGRWVGKADNLSDSIWRFMPEQFAQVASSNRQFRAQIMELAYMAARIAEPSNRGLSDNDIQNALERLVANSSNPQDIVRRFIEIQTDAAADLEFTLNTVKGAVKGAKDEDVERFLGGRGVGIYRERLQAMRDRFGITTDEVGRAVFASPLNDDVATVPGDIGRENAAQQTEELSDDEFLKEFNLDGAQ